jgi:hypothetical protein
MLWHVIHRPGRTGFLVLKHHAMKTYGGVELRLHALLTATLDGYERSASRSGYITADYTLRRGWVGPEPDWTCCWKEIFLIRPGMDLRFFNSSQSLCWQISWLTHSSEASFVSDCHYFWNKCHHHLHGSGFSKACFGFKISYKSCLKLNPMNILKLFSPSSTWTSLVSSTSGL